ncbi:hypothetical protein [Micromonospora chersina]
MTSPSSDAPPPAEASAGATAPEDPPVIVDVIPDPMLAQTLVHGDVVDTYEGPDGLEALLRESEARRRRQGEAE